ncbi:tail fiber assembly protein [Pseudomonas sp. S09G 359]|jgi:hypothetical protein|uniref:tail fiber assembly protein n=1 Tax=Pseudomonas sp. S09G 359 TaxID=2054919 RepID=UPI0021145E9F|nr:tail fiber assembly protein [Pseudomonas sp. S09G 359]
MKYLQIIDDIVVSAFAGAQDPQTGVQGLTEVADDDARYLNFVTPRMPDQAVMAYSTRDSLLGTAALRIAPLQDAVDVDRATDDEVARLTLWKNYRIDLNRIEQQTGFPANIDWPQSPDSVR